MQDERFGPTDRALETLDALEAFQERAMEAIRARRFDDFARDLEGAVVLCEQNPLHMHDPLVRGDVSAFFGMLDKLAKDMQREPLRTQLEVLRHRLEAALTAGLH